MSKLKTFRLVLFSHRELCIRQRAAAMAMMRAVAQSDTGVVSEPEAVNGTCSHHRRLSLYLTLPPPVKLFARRVVSSCEKYSLCHLGLHCDCGGQSSVFSPSQSQRRPRWHRVS